MGLCLGYDSAIRYWLTKGAGEALPDCTQDRSLAFAESGIRAVRREQLPFGPDARRPLHLVVPNRTLGHVMPGVVAHVWSPALPPGSLYALAGGNRVCSPELAFVQMAGRCTLWESIELACYLCSGFCVTDKGRGYAGARTPLTTVERLRSFAEQLPPRSYGARKATKALRFAVDAAASPMEVLLAMSFALPAEHGGRGPYALQANQLIRIDEHLQRLLDSGYLVGDLYLPEHETDLEYDSIEYHTGRHRLDHTQARRNALEAMGIKTVSATYGQINNLERFDDFTWMLERRLGVAHHDYTPRQRAAQVELYAFLTDHTRTLF